MASAWRCSTLDSHAESIEDSSLSLAALNFHDGQWQNFWWILRVEANSFWRTKFMWFRLNAFHTSVLELHSSHNGRHPTLRCHTPIFHLLPDLSVSTMHAEFVTFFRSSNEKYYKLRLALRIQHVDSVSDLLAHPFCNSGHIWQRPPSGTLRLQQHSASTHRVRRKWTTLIEHNWPHPYHAAPRPKIYLDARVPESAPCRTNTSAARWPLHQSILSWSR